jgi:hypothetical protein
MDPKEAVQFMREASDHESHNRTEALDDLKFRFGDQWPVEVQNSRTLQERPCLTINEVDSFCRQVENQQRQQRPRIKVHAVDDVADPKIAKVISGLMRHFEVNSDADNAYDLAFAFAVTIGWGYFRMRTDYTREDSFDQDIYFDQVENPFTVYFDPYSTLPDGSDADKVLITDLMKKTTFQKMYPSAETQGFTQLAAGDSLVDWVQEHDIRVAEFFYADRKKDTLIKLSSGAILWQDQLPEAPILEQNGIKVSGTRESWRRTIKWCKQTAYEILDQKDIPGRYIPVIPVYGNSYIINGRRIRFGLMRFAKDPQKMVNFWQTAMTEYLALAPKAKWQMAAGQDEGYENEYAQANISTRSTLHYNPRVEGVPETLGPPERIAPEPPPAGLIEASMMASQNLSRVLGIYDPGISQSKNHKSDKTINAEDQQTDQSNFQYYDNLTRSIKHAGRIALGWIPKYFDTERVMRIIGEDGRPDMVTVNEKQQGQNEQGDPIQTVLNDVTVGEYDIVMDTGPGYDSKRQEAVAIFGQMLGTPLGEKIAAVADDVIIRNMDVPGAEVIADRLAAANPLAQIDDKSDIPPKAQMQIKSLQQKLDQATQALQQAGLEIKYRANIEKMKQDGEDKRELMRSTTKAHDIEKIAATKQHDTEVRAITAQNVAEIGGIVDLLLKHIDTQHLEKELEMRNKELTQKSNESAETLQ